MSAALVKTYIIATLSAGVLCTFVYMGYDYYQLIGERAAWQGKYDQLKQAQVESEAEARRLREKREELDKSLSEWRATLETIRKQTAATSQSIRSLENANKEVRDILRLVIPVDLRRLLFSPSAGHNPGDENRARSVPPDLGAGVPDARSSR